MKRKEKIDFSDIPELTREQILSGRHPAPEEVEAARRGIERKLGIKRPQRGRPPKHPHHKYRPVYIRLHPKALAWAKAESRRLHIGYQTLINQILLHKAA
jgi:hypothetical protein